LAIRLDSARQEGAQRRHRLGRPEGY